MSLSLESSLAYDKHMHLIIACLTGSLYIFMIMHISKVLDMGSDKNVILIYFT